MTAIARTPVSISSPSDLWQARREFLDGIVESGRIDDILALCNQAVNKVGFVRASVPLPRTLTDNEYAAVCHAFSKSGWQVDYSLLGLITGNRKLVISAPDFDE